MNIIDRQSDVDTINYMSKSLNLHDLNKALDRSGLVQKEVQYKTPTGKIATRKQWVKASEDTTETKAAPPKREEVPSTPVVITENLKHLVPMKSIEELPDFLKGKIPPDWREVLYSPDPNPESDILAVGKDSQNRPQYRYTDDHWEKADKKKFERVMKLVEHPQETLQRIKDLHDTLPDDSDCLILMYYMAIRPGSERDTKSKQQAYGATTLLGKHVVIEGDKVYLRFIGKEGVSQDHEVTESSLIDILLKRKESAGDNGQLFKCSDTDLRADLKPLGIKPKDLRTMRANIIAKTWLSDVEPVTDVKEFVKIRNTVGDAVCSVLGNKRTMSLKSYINPQVFAEWSPEAYKAWIDSKSQETQKGESDGKEK